MKNISKYIFEKLNSELNINVLDVFKIKTGEVMDSNFLKVNYSISGDLAQKLYDVYNSDDIDVIEGDIIEKSIDENEFGDFLNNLDSYSKKNITDSFIQEVLANDPNNPDVSPLGNNVELDQKDINLVRTLQKVLDIKRAKLVKIVENPELQNKFGIIVSYKKSINKYIEKIG